MNIDAIAAAAGAAVKAEIPAMMVMDNPLVMPQPPSWTLFDFTVDTHKTFNFASEVSLTFRVIVGRQDPESGGKFVRDLAGDGVGTPFYALEKPHILGLGGQTLGGACDDFKVETVRGYRLYVYGTVSFIGYEMVCKAIGERAS